MRLTSILPAEAVLVLSLIDPATALLQCDKIVADGHKFDLSKLSGPHSVTVSTEVDGVFYNNTYTADICKGLKREGKKLPNDECATGTRVCAAEREIKDGEDTFLRAYPIAGELGYLGQGGGPLDYKAYNLRTSDSIGDSKKEGVRLIMNGGRLMEHGVRRYQRAIIEFVCDRDREGTEGEYTPKDDKYVDDNEALLRVRSFGAMDDGGQGDGEQPAPKERVQLGDGKNASLVFESYESLDSETNTDVLKLTWRTKYACEDNPDDGNAGPSSSGWGFFTWLVILVFLGTAAYLIFGSWLNYNRYGARGWDLLPHGDTIRDIPYLMKDWTRRVVSTVQGSGSRGGYSAV